MHTPGPQPRPPGATIAETIVACATAPGRSGRTIVRLSGPAVETACSSLFQPATNRRGVCRGDVLIGGRPCPAIVLRGVGPASYTGEDTLEVVLPGNPDLVERFVEACCAVAGVRRAGPGEFSARAYLNGRLALDEAEGVAAVIAARTSDDLAAAQQLASGELGRVYRDWADELTTLLALIEAGIDFVDQEDVVPILPRDLQQRLGRVRREMAERSKGGIAESAEGLPPLVVLAGAPNAGKSTLFNALLGRARSVVAAESGTTRDVLIETLALEEAAGPGLAVRLADLPGLDADATGGAAQAAQEAAIETLDRADAVVYCDPQGRFVGLETGISSRVPMLRVQTKADLPSAALLEGTGHAPGTAGGSSDVAVCALDGWRLDVVRRGIADIALRAPGGSCAVALARHAREIGRAACALEAVEAEIDPTARALDAPELVADGLRSAVDSLGQILGRITPDDVIGRVFATFCVGK
ncbi:MAG: GTPase [Planctomycetota bacterium]|nr:GTPase [Planctomycetota bacterium]